MATERSCMPLSGVDTGFPTASVRRHYLLKLLQQWESATTLYGINGMFSQAQRALQAFADLYDDIYRFFWRSAPNRLHPPVHEVDFVTSTLSAARIFMSTLTPLQITMFSRAGQKPRCLDIVRRTRETYSAVAETCSERHVSSPTQRKSYRERQISSGDVFLALWTPFRAFFHVSAEHCAIVSRHYTRTFDLVFHLGTCRSLLGFYRLMYLSDPNFCVQRQVIPVEQEWCAICFYHLQSRSNILILQTACLRL